MVVDAKGSRPGPEVVEVETPQARSARFAHEVKDRLATLSNERRNVVSEGGNFQVLFADTTLWVLRQGPLVFGETRFDTVGTEVYKSGRARPSSNSQTAPVEIDRGNSYVVDLIEMEALHSFVEDPEGEQAEKLVRRLAMLRGEIPEGYLAAKLRSELEGVAFSDPRARVFRDFADYSKAMLKAESNPNDVAVQLSMVLVEERISAKMNEDQEYGNAFSELVEETERVTGLAMGDLDESMLDGLSELGMELFYPRFAINKS